MAFYSQAAHSKGFFGRAALATSELLSSLLTHAEQRRVYNQTVAALNEMTDRQLEDINVNRHEIHELAREAAFKG